MSSDPDIVKRGWLRRVKNQKKRYFVLCFNKETGAAQLQYYESEKKFNSNSEPRRTIFLKDCLGIISKKDPKYGHLLVLYTKDDIFAVTAETEKLLESWLSNLDKLHKMEYKNLLESKYDLVWHVKVIPRGLGAVKNMTGSYKLCLKDDSLFFVNPTTQDVLNEEKLYHIRRYGHMDYCFFMEFGRSTTLGAGEIWMEVEDPLIAQKIHETLSRSVKPASGEGSSAPNKTRSNRHSMVSYRSDKYAINYDTNTSNNNNPSPKTRRSTLLPNVFSKKKDTQRPHSQSLSVPSHVTEQEAKISERPLHFTPYTNPKDDEDSEEEGKHYPHVIPPLPGAGRKTSSYSFSGELEENIPFKSKKKGSMSDETKSLSELPVLRRRENDYAETRTKRRSVIKQDCSAVRNDYAAEKRRSTSLSRNQSRTSIDRLRKYSDRHSDGEKNDDTDDKDGARESDKEDDGNYFPLTGNHYLNMNPRQRITSDSSVEETSPYLSVGPPSGVYIKMSSPRATPNLESSRHSTSSLHSSSSCNSAEESTMVDHGSNLYVNMKPGKGPRPRQRFESSSNESAEETLAAEYDDDTGGETFDHLNRDDFLNHQNALTQGKNEPCAYVNLSPRSKTSVGIKKSHSHLDRSPRSDYVNVNVSRSKSVSSKTPRRRPVFEIVPELTPRSSSDGETGRQSPSSYVNMVTKDPEQIGPYTKIVPGKKPQDGVSGRKSPELNYASVDFSGNKCPDTNGIQREVKHGRRSPSNYSKIDFNKSQGLADVSCARDRELQRIS